MPSIISSLFSDNIVQSSLYINDNNNPKDFLNYLKKILIEIDNDGKNDRLNWNFLSSKLLAKILLEGNKIEILNSLENISNFNNLSYRYEIKPIEEKYKSTTKIITETINVKIYDSENILFVDKLLSEIIDKDLLTKDDFVFKDLNKEEIINYLNDKNNFKNIIPYDQKFLLSDYSKNNVNETLEFFNKFKADNNSFIVNKILNSGYEILRVDDWIIVSYMGFVEKLVNGYELTNGITNIENDLFIIVGKDESITVKNDGTVFLSRFN